MEKYWFALAEELSGWRCISDCAAYVGNIPEIILKNKDY